MQGPSIPHSGFHPGAFPGMFKSALCMFVPSGHFRISQNIQSPQMETLFPCLSPFLSSPGWGLGHCRALFRGCRKHFKAQQSGGRALGKATCWARRWFEFYFTCLRSWDFLGQQGVHKRKKKVHWFPSPPWGGADPFGISLNSIIYSSATSVTNL